VLVRLHWSSINTLIYPSQVEIFRQKAVVLSDTSGAKAEDLEVTYICKKYFLYGLLHKKSMIIKTFDRKLALILKNTVNGRSFEDKLLLFFTLKGTGVPCLLIMAFGIKAFPPISQ